MSDLPALDRETCMDAFAATAAAGGRVRHAFALSVVAWRRSACWPLLLVVFLTTLGAATWRQWTVVAFPLDAGREMLVPRMMAEGQVLYRDIRCFYGPLGYWLNAAAVSLWGDGQDVQYALNAGRMALTLVVLWLLARQLLDRALAAVALATWAYTYFYSLAVPYSASLGWGILLLAGGALCAARQLRNAKTPKTSSAGIAWGIAAASLLSLAATTKHEYALAAAALLIVLLGDAWLRSGWAAVAVVGLAAIAPFAMVLAAVLRTVSLAELMQGNIWLPEMVRYYGGPAAYGPGAALGTWKALHLFELMGLLAIGVGGVGLLIGGTSVLVTGVRRSVPRRALLLAVLGFAIVGAVELYIRRTGVQASSPMDYPKSRLHSLVQFLHLLCLPLALAYLGLLLVRVRQRGVAAWRRLGAPGRLGVFCALGYLSLMSRQVPSAIELVREPFTPILLAWLLAIALPRIMRWRYLWRQAWAGGVIMLHFAGIASAVDHVNYFQSRPACFVEAGGEQTYVWQRRVPFRPTWFSDAVETVRGHEAEIREGGIACVPEGAWVHALLKLDWPTRDTQWMPYCQDWVLEDLDRCPPEFLLVMEPRLLSASCPRVDARIHELYREVERNASGMILYRLRNETREQWRPETDRRELERGTGWDQKSFAMRGSENSNRFGCSRIEG